MNNHVILMLEFDEDDQYITRDYFKNYHPQIDLHIVSTSEELMTFLQDCKQGKRRCPSLLLLNYHSTPLNATQVLSNMKEDPVFRHVPAVVLSGVVIPGIIRECYAAGASSFIRKPAGFEDTNRKISNFLEYWFNTVELS